MRLHVLVVPSDGEMQLERRIPCRGDILIWNTDNVEQLESTRRLTVGWDGDGPSQLGDALRRLSRLFPRGVCRGKVISAIHVHETLTNCVPVEICGQYWTGVIPA